MAISAEVVGFPECGVAVFIPDEVYKEFAQVAANFRCDPDQLAVFALSTFSREHSVIASAVRQSA